MCTRAENQTEASDKANHRDKMHHTLHSYIKWLEIGKDLQQFDLWQQITRTDNPRSIALPLTWIPTCRMHLLRFTNDDLRRISHAQAAWYVATSAHRTLTGYQEYVWCLALAHVVDPSRAWDSTTVESGESWLRAPLSILKSLRTAHQMHARDPCHEIALT